MRMSGIKVSPSNIFNFYRLICSIESICYLNRLITIFAACRLAIFGNAAQRTVVGHARAEEVYFVALLLKGLPIDMPCYHSSSSVLVLSECWYKLNSLCIPSIPFYYCNQLKKENKFRLDCMRSRNEMANNNIQYPCPPSTARGYPSIALLLK